LRPKAAKYERNSKLMEGEGSKKLKLCLKVDVYGLLKG